MQGFYGCLVNSYATYFFLSFFFPLNLSSLSHVAHYQWNNRKRLADHDIMYWSVRHASLVHDITDCQAQNGSTQGLVLFLNCYSQMSFLNTLDHNESQDSLVVEHQTRDRKVLNSSPGKSGRRIFFSKVNFVWYSYAVSIPPLCQGTLSHSHLSLLSHCWLILA